MILLIIFAAIGIAIPIIGSFALCVPKWYREVVSPRIPPCPHWYRDLPEPDGMAWYMIPFRLFTVLIALPVFAVAMVGTKYWLSVMSLIERKCPYTPALRTEEYESQHQTALRFRGMPTSGFARLWEFLLGNRESL